MTAILQCLLHCPLLQKYFLKDVNHDQVACEILRRRTGEGNVCIACEVDNLFVETLSSTMGIDFKETCSFVEKKYNHCSLNFFESDYQIFQESFKCSIGRPINPSKMLEALWDQNSNMKHLSGYVRNFDALMILIHLMMIFCIFHRLSEMLMNSCWLSLIYWESMEMMRK